MALPRTPGLDPFEIQPGAIVLDRFCVIGQARHEPSGWRVLVTDLDRSLGSAPLHQIELHHLAVDQPAERAIKLALPVYMSESLRIHADFAIEGGIVLACHPVEGAMLQRPLAISDAHMVLVVLTRVLEGVHRAGLSGVTFDPRDLRLDSFGRLRFANWHHLRGLIAAVPGSPGIRRDVVALVELAEQLSPDLRSTLGSAPKSAVELLKRLDDGTAQVPTLASSAGSSLPVLPPFTGRASTVLALHRAVGNSRHGGPQPVVVSGPHASGRSRLTSQLVLELMRGEGVLIVHVDHPEDNPATRGLSRIMAQVAQAILGLGADERAAIIKRIAVAVGPHGGLLRSLDARLASLLGEVETLPHLAVEKRFVRHAATAAALLSALGTPTRPLLLVLDDAHRSDASTRALIYHLLVPGQQHHTTVLLTTPEGEALDLPRPAEHLMLQRLSTAELNKLVHAVLPGVIEQPEEIVRHLVEHGATQPGDAWDHLRAAVRGGLLLHADAAWRFDRSAPAKVLPFEPIGSFAELPPDAQRIAALLAVRPQPAEPAWLRRVMGWQSTRLRESVEAIVDAGLTLIESSGRLAWVSGGVRDRVIASAPAASLALAHGEIAAWLSTVHSRGTAPQLAWHAEHAPPSHQPEELLELHLRAAEVMLEAYDAERAQWHADRAHGAALTPPDKRRALEARADALMLQDRPNDALAAYLNAIEHADDREQALSIAHRGLHGMWMRGAIDASMALADRGLRAVGLRLPQGPIEAVVQAVWALTRAIAGRPRAQGGLADQLCGLYTYLTITGATSHPHVVLSSIARGLESASGRRSASASRARAMFAAVLPSRGPFTTWAARLIGRALHDANAAGDAEAVGIAHHVQGDRLLASGSYDEGQVEMNAALKAFQHAGDMSIGVSTMCVAALYAFDREPVPALQDRVATATVSAYRQRNRSVLPGLAGMEQVLAARMGQPVTVLDSAFEPLANDVVGAVVGDSMTAHALLIAGDAHGSSLHANRALRRLSGTRIYPPFLDVARTTAVRCVISASVGEPTRDVLAYERDLWRRARRNPSLKVSSKLVRALLYMRMDRAAEARELLASVIEHASTHRMPWVTLEAHECMAQILAGRDARTARAHADLAQTLRAGLIPDAEPSPLPRADGAAQPDTTQTRLDALIDKLPNIVAPLLGSSELRVETAAGLACWASPELVELVLVNMVLAARDTGAQGAIRLLAQQRHLDSYKTAELPGCAPGDWVRIGVETLGRGKGSRGALAECGDLCRRAGGAFEQRDGWLVAWLPSAPGAAVSRSRRVVWIVHRDPRVCRTLVDGVTRLGFASQVSDQFVHVDEADIAIVEDALAPAGSDSDRVIRVRPRGNTQGRGRAELGFPFLVRELEVLLAAAAEEATTNASAPRSV